ncbi:MAG TPA: OmpA family protein [Polyangia bacterium]|nr:OmpA family protein [Polyangia bacterium]
MTRLKLCISIALVAGVTLACATKEGTGALVGAGGGAALGAGVGALAGGGKGALIGGAVGAGVGAATGAVIGHYMDKQEADMKKNVKGAKIERQGDKLVVQFNSAILFDTNKTDLKPAAQHDLSEFAKVLVQYPDTDIIVEGHTDNKGKKEKNKKLSVARAESVIKFLESQGVAGPRMTPEGFGDEKPVADNKTAEGRQANRRVQIEINANAKLKQQDAAGTQPQQGS